MNKKSIALMVIGGGCFLVFAFLVLAGLGMVFLGGTPSDWSSDETRIEDVYVELDDVIHTKVGDDFILEVNITNTGPETRNLDSIDIESVYLEGVVVNKTQPANGGFEHIVAVAQDFSTYTFQRDLAPSSTQTIEFYMTATKAGIYTGYIDVCIDSANECNWYEASIIVEE